MKKILLYITILLLPIIVKAELTTPNQIGYEAKTNKEIILYNESLNEVTNISTDTEIKINSEKTINGETYGSIVYNNEKYLVKINDIDLKYNKLSANSLTRKQEKKLITIANTKIYKGPSIKYEELTESIPANEELTTYYYDDVWSYVDYNGSTGWIYTYSYEELKPYDIDCTVGKVEDKKIKILTTDNITLKNNPLAQETNNKIIPANTELEYKYYYELHDGSKYLYVEKDNNKGWFEVNYSENDNLAAFKYDCNYIYVTNNYINFYSKYNDISSKTSVKILQGTELEILYTATIKNKCNWYYVKYKGEYGWVLSEQYNTDTSTPPFAVYNGTSYKYKTNQELELYKAPNSGNIEGKIPSSTIFVATYILNYQDTRWLYATYNNQKGWVKANNVSVSSSITECLDIKEEEKQTYDTTTTPSENENNTPQATKKSSLLKTILPKIIAILLIIGLLIFFIIKSKKDKNKLINQQKEQKQGTTLQSNQATVTNTTNQTPITIVSNQPLNQTVNIQNNNEIVPIDGITNAIPINDSKEVTNNLNNENMFEQKEIPETKYYNE